MSLSPSEILEPVWHPLLPNLSRLQVEEYCATEAGRKAYAEFLTIRQQRLDDADEVRGDPYFGGWELDHWKVADEELKREGVRGQYVAGGKRATKSERAAWRVVQAAMNLPRARIWCLQGSLRTSISEQQELIWKYLPRDMKRLNGRVRHGFAKINWSQDGGFCSGQSHMLVLPNRSEIHFLSYEQDPKQYQGWKLGAEITGDLRVKVRETPWLFNMGAWADEDMPLPWYETIVLRCATRHAVWMWTFSTMDGITTTIKEVVGVPNIISTRTAELLPKNQVHVPKCPAGHVPFVARAQRGTVSVVYFHTDLNPFPPNYQNVRQTCEGKPVRHILEHAYGWSEDTRHRAFPQFGSWNIVRTDQIPKEGTNYMFTDPAGARMWFCIWVRVVSSSPAYYYIYRDWPDEGNYGAWAVPSKNPKDFDGDKGPAQRGLGFGFSKYKQEWLKVEKGEAIYERFIDPRAARDERTAQTGGTCPIDELAKEHRDSDGKLEAPAMYFIPAPGLSREAGLTQINQLLEWDMSQPLCKITNEPKLYVSEECQQVIWCLANDTATDPGDRAGSKDVEDVLRYMATADLVYVPVMSQQRTRTMSY